MVSCDGFAWRSMAHWSEASIVSTPISSDGAMAAIAFAAACWAMAVLTTPPSMRLPSPSPFMPSSSQWQASIEPLVSMAST